MLFRSYTYSTSYYSPNTTWLAVNDPSPAAFRVPTVAESESLVNTAFVTRLWTTLNGVAGYRFTDNGADGRGNAGNSIFLPAAGSLANPSNPLNPRGYYWTSTQESALYAYRIYFDNLSAFAGPAASRVGKNLDYTVRPVAE